LIDLLRLNYNYCVAPFPALTSTSVSSMPTGNFSSGGMNNSPLPTAGYTPTFYTQTLDPVGIPAPTNLANGTRTINCGYYYDVKSGDTLSSISSLVQLNASDLETWNPQLALAAPVTGTSICVRFPTGNYTLATAARPANAALNSTTDCAQWYTVVGGDGCPSIESKFDLTSGELSQLNRGCQSFGSFVWVLTIS
jgi:LysM repeat protein